MKNITVCVPDETYRRARVWAAERETSVSQIVAYLLETLPNIKRATRRFPIPGQPAPLAADPGPTLPRSLGPLVPASDAHPPMQPQNPDCETVESSNQPPINQLATKNCPSHTNCAPVDPLQPTHPQQLPASPSTGP